MNETKRIVENHQRLELAHEQQNVATHKLQIFLDRFQRKLLNGDRLVTEDFVGLIGAITDFMQATETLKRNMTDGFSLTVSAFPSVIQDRISEMLVSSIDAKTEHYHDEKWRNGPEGAAVEGRIQALEEILGWLSSNPR